MTHKPGVLSNTTTQHQRYLTVQKLFSNNLHKPPSEQMTKQAEELKHSIQEFFQPDEDNIQQLFQDYVEDMKEMKMFDPILELTDPSEFVLGPVHLYIPMKVFTALLLRFPGARFDFRANENNVSDSKRLTTYLYFIHNKTEFPLLLCEDKAHATSAEDYEQLKETAKRDMKNGIFELSKRSQNINFAKYEIILMQTVGSDFYLSSFYKKVCRNGNELQTAKNNSNTITLNYTEHSNLFSMKNLIHVFDAITKCLNVLIGTVEFLIQRLEQPKVKFNHISYPKITVKPTKPKYFFVGSDRYTFEFTIQENIFVYAHDGIDYFVKHIGAYEKSMIEAVQQCGSPYTVPGIFSQIESSTVFIMKRYSTFQSALINLDFDKIVHIARQLLQGIQIYHQYGILHSDIKPSNIVFNRDQIYFIDFGICQLFDDLNGETALFKGKPIHKQAGTPYFDAPECKKQRYGPKIDLYGIGVTLLCMLSGIEAFDDDSEIYITDVAKFVHDYEQAKPFQTLLTHLLKQDPKERWGVVDSLSELERMKPVDKQVGSDLQHIMT